MMNFIIGLILGFIIGVLITLAAAVFIESGDQSERERNVGEDQ